MKLKPKCELWTVRTYDHDYEMENFYKFTNESDVANFASGKIAVTCWGVGVRLGKHEEICTLKHTIDYDVEVDES